jgi:hypothetical protein
MNEIERYLDHVCRGVGGSPSLRKHIREELREHLLEAIESHTAEGLSREAALAKAIEEFGTAEAVSEGLTAVYGRRLLGIVVEKAMAWKEATMKTGWKWSFAAQLIVALAIAAQVFFISAVLVYVYPKVEAQHETLGVPPLTQGVISFSRTLNDTWHVWLPAIAACWLVFEWRYRGESKSAIRLAAGGGASLLLTAFIAAASFGAIVPLIRLVDTISGFDVSPVIMWHAEEADAAFNRLAQALGTKDWAAVSDASAQLRGAFQHLQRSGAAARTLVTLSQREGVARAKGLLAGVTEIAHEICANLAVGDRTATEQQFTRLKAAYDELLATVKDWPRAASRP